jgi:hypothetical protein
MKARRAKPAAKRSDGGSQTLNIGPRGVTEKDSPTINALKRKPRDRDKH